MTTQKKSPPPARKEVVKDNYYGTIIEDPYRWMEDYQSQELQDWLKAQADYAKDYLEALPVRNAFLERITELSRAGPDFFNHRPAGEWMFYQRRDPDDLVARLCMCPLKGGDERVLFDPNTLEGDVHTAIDWYHVSPNGKTLVYAISEGGSENSVLHIMDVESGTTQDVQIPRAIFATLDWLDDERFIYNRLPELTPETPANEYYCNSRMYLRIPGQDYKDDPVILGRGANIEVEFVDIDIPAVGLDKNSAYIAGAVMHGDASELSIYVASREALENGQTPQWRDVADIEHGVTDAVLHQDRIFLLTHHNAPRYKVLAVSAETPDISQAEVIVPASEAVIQNMMIVGDTLVTFDLVNGISQMRAVDLNTGDISPVELPFEGSIYHYYARSAQDRYLYFPMVGWTNSQQLYRYDVQTGDVINTELVPPSPIDFSDIEAREVLVEAYDGTPIPLSIIHRKGLELDGERPTLLMGYGSYGITIPAMFLPTMRAWYEQGGVYAVAHLRGGGELGKEWHEAGQFLNKGNTIDDFLACGEFLIANGYTNPEKLAGEGTSAGGIPSGGGLVKRPDLWAAMVIRVGVTNALRFEHSENGPPNVMEFGSTSTEQGFESLRIIDSYHKVIDGVFYPGVLLTSGANDPRVVVWMATKMAARLQNATGSDNPVLLRVEYQGGHGAGSTKEQVNEELADKLAFLWQQMKLS